MDTTTVTLPVSGKKVEVRNYTTVADDNKSDSVLFAGVTLDQNASKEQLSSFKFPFFNLMESQRVYVNSLVKSIDGNSEDLIKQIDELRSEDYKVLQEAVDKIVQEHSPKVKKALKN